MNHSDVFVDRDKGRKEGDYSAFDKIEMLVSSPAARKIPPTPEGNAHAVALIKKAKFSENEEEQRQASEEYLTRHLKFILRQLYGDKLSKRIMRQRSDLAADLVNESMMQFFRALNTFDEEKVLRENPKTEEDYNRIYRSKFLKSYEGWIYQQLRVVLSPEHSGMNNSQANRKKAVETAIEEMQAAHRFGDRYHPTAEEVSRYLLVKASEKIRSEKHAAALQEMQSSHELGEEYKPTSEEISAFILAKLGKEQRVDVRRNGRPNDLSFEEVNAQARSKGWIDPAEVKALQDWQPATESLDRKVGDDSGGATRADFIEAPTAEDTSMGYAPWQRQVLYNMTDRMMVLGRFKQGQKDFKMVEPGLVEHVTRLKLANYMFGGERNSAEIGRTCGIAADDTVERMATMGILALAGDAMMELKPEKKGRGSGDARRKKSKLSKKREANVFIAQYWSEEHDVEIEQLLDEEVLRQIKPLEETKTMERLTLYPKWGESVRSTLRRG